MAVEVSRFNSPRPILSPIGLVGHKLALNWPNQRQAPYLFKLPAQRAASQPLS